MNIVISQEANPNQDQQSTDDAWHQLPIFAAADHTQAFSVYNTNTRHIHIYYVNEN